MSTIAERGDPAHQTRPAAPREAFLESLASPRAAGAPTIHVALVNNMPDIALSRTELQFMDMLQQAAGDVQVRLSLYSLPVIARGERGLRHLASSYRPIDDLWRNPPDAVVVSGTEPIAADLRDEPYWCELTALIDWIDAAGIPALFSCLAAHTAALHRDGIARARLPQKCFGLFENTIVEHALTEGAGAQMTLPHTRWNGISEESLVAGGYTVLSRSASVGVGFFTKSPDGAQLFCQGHPEYDAPSLFREYRRDVLRFLRRERAAYPEVPRSYFAPHDADRFEAFKSQAMKKIDEAAMAEFPEEPAFAVPPWRNAAIAITRNWLKAGVPHAWANGD